MWIAESSLTRSPGWDSGKPLCESGSITQLKKLGKLEKLGKA